MVQELTANFQEVARTGFAFNLVVACNFDPCLDFAMLSSCKSVLLMVVLCCGIVAALLKDWKLLDLPKLLDICAVYNHDNHELTSHLVCHFCAL